MHEPYSPEWLKVFISRFISVKSLELQISNLLDNAEFGGLFLRYPAVVASDCRQTLQWKLTGFLGIR